MTLQEDAVARIARDDWKRRSETAYFKSELQREYEAHINNLVARGCTPGVTLEEMIRIAAKARQTKEIIEKL